MRRALATLALALGLLAAVPLHADPPAARLPAASAPATPAATVGLRAGRHPGFGRLVFDLPPGASAMAVAGVGGIVVHIAGAALGPAPPLPRNLRGLEPTPDGARLILAPGRTWRQMLLPGRLVIDVLDPLGPAVAAPRRTLFSGPPPRPAPAPVAPPVASSPAVSPPVAPAPALPAAIPSSVAPPAEPSLPPSPEPPSQPKPQPAPIAPVEKAALSSAPSAGQPTFATGAGVALPFAPGTGAAAFRRGETTVVVFDERQPIDPASLARDPALAAARVQLLPAATVLTLKLPPGAALRLAPASGGWTIASVPADPPPPLAPIRPEPAEGRLRLAAEGAGHVVSVPDPQTGGTLLVGTQTVPGQGVAVVRRAPDFALLATFQGVAVEPLSDGVVLRAVPPGFVLEPAAGRALALDPAEAGAAVVAEAAHLTRRWDFPNLPEAALLRRLQVAMEAAANAPPQARAARRLAAVQAQLALGLGAEAQALAMLAASEDAQAAEAPDAAGLAALGALLAGRLDVTEAIEDPRFSGTDEVAFWRAVRRAARSEASPEAAQVFGATLPLLLAYPAPLQARLLPLVTETLVKGGERAAARRLLASRPDDSSLDYARALLAEADSQSVPALTLLDKLAQSPDQRLRARAAVRAVELRLRLGALGPAQAADALERLIYAWRGDGRELALRLRVAELRAQGGQWPAALALLRESAAPPLAESWPAQVPALRARLQAMFARALEADAQAKLPPLDLVALIEENPDLLPGGDAGRALASRLADRLLALDLPRRAAALLQKLVDGTPPGAARAELGSRLAELLLAGGDATGALTALSASAATELPADLVERRTLVFARATAARGALGPAVAALAALDSAAADAARAELLETAKDWPAATAALADYARRTVPAEGPLDAAAARTLLRLASAAAQADDESVLAALRVHDLPRFPPGQLGDLLRVLTATPVQGVPDLPRAAEEAALARRLPVALQALAAPSSGR